MFWHNHSVTRERRAVQRQNSSPKQRDDKNFDHLTRKNCKLECFKLSGMVDNIVKCYLALKIESMNNIKQQHCFSCFTLCIGIIGEGGKCLGPLKPSP